jgi:hypothetical protein
MTTHTNHDAIEALGYAIEARGIDADPVALLLLAHSARDMGVSEFLVSLMVDDDQPAVARVRAFARVSSLVSLALDDERAASAGRALHPAC